MEKHGRPYTVLSAAALARENILVTLNILLAETASTEISYSNWLINDNWHIYMSSFDLLAQMIDL
jgi:hypothetical protein